MKKIFLLFIVFCFSTIKAQDALRNNINLVLSQKYSDINTTNKLLLVHRVSSSQEQSKNDITNELEKTTKVYANAKLKGGTKGMICVVIAENTNQVIALKKNLKYCQVLSEDDFESSTLKAFTTTVIDANGNITNDHVQAKSIYSTIQSLITR